MAFLKTVEDLVATDLHSYMAAVAELLAAAPSCRASALWLPHCHCSALSMPENRLDAYKLDGIIDSMDMNLSKLQETAKVREAWRAAAHGVAKSWTQLSG